MTIKEKYKKACEAAELRDSNLLADMPDFEGAVSIWHQDGSSFFYTHASMKRLVVDGTAFILVFSEHNGTKVYFQDDLESYRQYSRGQSVEEM